MVTSGERFTQRLVVEAPEFCNNSCSKFVEWLIRTAGDVNAGIIDPEFALDPLVALVKSCSRAVEAGGLNPVGATQARQDLNAMDLRRPEQVGTPCVMDTSTFWHAEMYARGEDPYFGFLDDDDLDDDE